MRIILNPLLFVLNAKKKYSNRFNLHFLHGKVINHDTMSYIFYQTLTKEH